MSRLLLCLTLVALAACNETTEPLDLAGDPVALEIASGNNQSALIGTPLAQPLVARVVDAGDRPVPGIEVSWSASAGTLESAVTESDADGRAATSLTLPGTTGPVTVTAVLDGIDTVAFEATATPTSGALVFRYVEVGSYHACAITTAEESICWGFNEDGQTATGVLSPISGMARVASGLSVRVTSSGRYHSCEVTLSGDVYCSGSNTTGQVNGSPSAPFPSFTRVQPLPATAFRIVAAGLSHSCALSLSQQLWCWGSNGEGQIGNGLVEPGAAYAPVFIGDGYRAVTATGLHTCALTVAGNAECWGWNASGQLGDGSTETRGTPIAITGFTFRTEPSTVPPAPDPDFYIPGQAYISAGFAHTCGILVDNTAACWGEGENGQLGRGTAGDANLPVPVSGGLEFRAISAGYRHTCAIAVDGAAYCWGDNAQGQLGDGSFTSSLTPVPVSGGLTWQSISAGDTFSCGVTTGGVLYCWGDNVYGQLGTTGGGSPAPVPLPFQM